MQKDSWRPGSTVCIGMGACIEPCHCVACIAAGGTPSGAPIAAAGACGGTGACAGGEYGANIAEPHCEDACGENPCAPPPSPIAAPEPSCPGANWQDAL